MKHSNTSSHDNDNMKYDNDDNNTNNDDNNANNDDKNNNNNDNNVAILPIVNHPKKHWHPWAVRTICQMECLV